VRAARARRRPAAVARALLGAALAGISVVFASPAPTRTTSELEGRPRSRSAPRARARHRGHHRAARAGDVRAGVVVAAGMAREDLASSRLAELRGVAAALPPGVVVSEDPLLLIVAGQRPLVLDGFMLRLAAERDPAVARPLLDGLRRDEFAAVVLLQDLESPDARGWYRRGNLGLEVVGEVARHYRLAERYGRYHLYLPFKSASGEAPVRRHRRAKGGSRPASARPARAPEIPASSAAPPRSRHA
jgi:hypothetical protein